MNWRHYRIGVRRDGSIRVYAPSLLWAFHIARRQRFGSAKLTCFGSR